MTLANAIAALHRQDYDALLVGSKYHKAGKVRRTGFTYEASNLSATHTLDDALSNAAKVIVLEQAVAQLREALEHSNSWVSSAVDREADTSAEQQLKDNADILAATEWLVV